MKVRTILVAAPSGAGKSSFVDRVVKELPQLEDVITYTTRGMRHHEVQGHPYHFISENEFKKKVDQGFFVEWAKVHTNLYGTSMESLENAWKGGKVVIMDLDIQGVKTFRQKLSDGLKTVFILPPSLEELKRRIIHRDKIVPPDIEVRMKNASIEMNEAVNFDYKVVNEEFEESYNNFKKIIEELLRLR
jgi:guanylate kinase